MEKKVKSIIELIIVCILIVLWIYLAFNVINIGVLKLDEIGYNLVSSYLISESITPIVKIITQFGGVTFIAILTIILMISIKDKNQKKIISLNIISAALIIYAIKNIIQRQRPISNRIINETGYSFPSGHSMASMVFYGFLIYLINKNVKNKYVKFILTILLTLLIMLIGISRIYLGVHYTSDVLAGFLLGIIHVYVIIKLCKI